MWKNLKQQGYGFNKNRLSKENIRGIIEGSVIVLMLAAFFYRSLWAVPFLIPVFLLYYKEKKRKLALKQRKKTAIQFKDTILSVSANQKAGYSAENSFRQAYGDMAMLYGKDSLICVELYGIIVGLGNNMVLEKLLYDFGKRSRVEEVKEFAEVFAAAKRNGGNMTEIIERYATVIEGKIETEKDIQILLSARQMEQRIMNIVPFGILLYISATSKGFFDVLYHNPPGIIIMTICLAIYIAAVFLSNRIVSIEV